MSVLCALAVTVSAHDAGTAVMQLEVIGREVDFELHLTSRDLAAALGRPSQEAGPPDFGVGPVTKYLTGRVQLRANGKACEPRPIRIQALEEADDVVISTRYRCHAHPQTLSIAYQVLFDLDPSHICVGRLRAGSYAEDLFFDHAYPVLDISLDQEPITTVGSRTQ